jgi:vanillate O-demethylase ferredoxin subunit
MDDQWLDLLITDIRQIAVSIKEFELRSTDGRPLPPFRAGAHLRMRLGIETGEVERCYSLINSTTQDGTYRIAVHRSPHSKGGSAFLCDEGVVGTRLLARRPKNDFALAPAAGRHVLLAGGIGITPILAMARELKAAKQSYSIHYVARSPEMMAYRDAIEMEFGPNANLYFDNGIPSQGLPLSDILVLPIDGTHVYACGPQALIDSVLAIAGSTGWNRNNIHFELFAPPTSTTPNTEFSVVLARSGVTVPISQSRNILDALLEHGCDLLYDCRRGECGICAVRVLEGIPDHKDYVLTESQRQENTEMCICVSRAKSAKLVLDI